MSNLVAIPIENHHQLVVFLLPFTKITKSFLIPERVFKVDIEIEPHTAEQVITIDVTKEVFHPPKPNYEKTRACLSKLPKFTILITWHPSKPEHCPSSIAKYLHDLGYMIEQCVPQFKMRTEYGVKVPQVDFRDTSEEKAVELIEWMGMLSLQGDLEDAAPNSYLTTYQAPEPNQLLGQVRYLEWRGFFVAKHICNLFLELRKYVLHERTPWISMYTQGFSDSPIAWNSMEHHYYTNGDNSHIIVFNDIYYINCSQRCTSKCYRSKYA